MVYIWRRPDWPKFHWDQQSLTGALADARLQQGRLLGRMEALGFSLREEAVLGTLSQDVLKSSEIEGEMLDAEQVRSSVARSLGMDAGGLKPAGRDVDGVVEMTLNAVRGAEKPLTQKRLFDWRTALFPAGRSGMADIRAGKWRDDSAGPMQAVSGPAGKQKVHYEAPPAARLKTETARFLKWFNAKPDTDPLLKAGLAHLWLVTVHPFDDGNGRIARAVTDMALARAERTTQRFYSMSAQIMAERDDYYSLLERTQKGALDVTGWQMWFLGCLTRAVEGAQETLSSVLFKAQLWERLAAEPLNKRQIKVLNRMLDGFEGKLTSSKWAKLAKCSQDTAHRDILDLTARGVLQKNPGGGRSTSYSIARAGF